MLPLQFRRPLFPFALLLIGLGLALNQWTVPLIFHRPVDATHYIRVWVLDFFLVLLGVTLILWLLRPKFVALSDAAIGILATITLWLMLEGGFYWLNQRQPTSPLHGYYTAQLYTPNADLGFQNLPNVQVQSVLLDDDRVIYQVTQTTDEFGRRLTPTNLTSDTFIVFMGGSYTFGWGVEDNETLPAQVAALTPNYAVYNYGVNAYGTAHMLARLEQHNLGQEIKQKKGVLIYTFIDNHVQRNIGSLNVYTSRGAFMPYYDQNLTRRGNMRSGRPLLSIIYDVLASSQVVKYFGLELPQIDDGHYEFTSRLIERSRQEFKQQYPAGEFYVLLFPGNGVRLRPYLEKLQINVLDYRQLLDNNPANWIPNDGHPTAHGYQTVARQIVRDLGLGPNH